MTLTKMREIVGPQHNWREHVISAQSVNRTSAGETAVRCSLGSVREIALGFLVSINLVNIAAADLVLR
jgi:hypothetical protein